MSETTNIEKINVLLNTRKGRGGGGGRTRASLRFRCNFAIAYKNTVL